MPEQQYPDANQFKRHVAFKYRIGEILEGKPIFDQDKFKLLELDNKEVVRVNVVANIIDKYIQDEEKKFGSLTLDDASGQIKLKVFGDDIKKFENYSQGDTIMIIGLLRHWNNEIYITPDLIKKKEPTYLLVRKLECDMQKPKSLAPEHAQELKDKILSLVKKEDENGGADIEKMILELKAQPNAINQEIRKLLEEGIIYEPRPGKIRYLG
jgi:uncharacterized protein